jgi:hypothetical protein
MNADLYRPEPQEAPARGKETRRKETAGSVLQGLQAIQLAEKPPSTLSIQHVISPAQQQGRTLSHHRKSRTCLDGAPLMTFLLEDKVTEVLSRW